MNLLKPRPLRPGDTIGIFTPSWPAHTLLRDKHLHALSQLKASGFSVLEGTVTARMRSEGYRSAPPQERAAEFMDLLRNPNVSALMATIGGSNSASLIPYLDFAEIRTHRKLICGYSDITSLHLAILTHSRLSTLYGPSLVPVFGEFPTVLPYALSSWLDAATDGSPRTLQPPPATSRQFIDAFHPDWKATVRTYQPNEGWICLSPGAARGPLVVADLETLLSLAGGPHIPDLSGTLLVLEEMDAPFSKEERNFRQLERMGVFDAIAGLLVSKPYNPDPEGAPFSYEDLILEIVGKRPYPIVSGFDCGHTFPSLSLPQGIAASLHAAANSVSFRLEELSLSDH